MASPLSKRDRRRQTGQEVACAIQFSFRFCPFRFWWPRRPAAPAATPARPTTPPSRSKPPPAPKRARSRA
ncbi:MAG: hypothetical protein EOP67_75025, partial [Sphingomonas sp.]